MVGGETKRMNSSKRNPAAVLAMASTLIACDPDVISLTPERDAGTANGGGPTDMGPGRPDLGSTADVGLADPDMGFEDVLVSAERDACVTAMFSTHPDGAFFLMRLEPPSYPFVGTGLSFLALGGPGPMGGCDSTRYDSAGLFAVESGDASPPDLIPMDGLTVLELSARPGRDALHQVELTTPVRVDEGQDLWVVIRSDPVSNQDRVTCLATCRSLAPNPAPNSFASQRPIVQYDWTAVDDLTMEPSVYSIEVSGRLGAP